MADGKRLDPHRGYNFRLTVNGKISGEIAFKKVSGLEIEVDVTEYREGTDTATVRKIPGLAKYPNIVCERGITDNAELIQWMQEVVDLTREGQLPPDDDFRGEIVVELLSRNRETIREWNATSGFPCKITVGEFDATSSDVVIEALEIAHEGLSLVAFA